MRPAMLPRGRFLSQEECVALVKQITGMAVGGGTTGIGLDTWWAGNVTWKRNEIRMATDVRDHQINISRTIRGARGVVSTNQISATSLEASVRRAERLVIQSDEDPTWFLQKFEMEPYDKPVLWFDRSYNLDAQERAEVVRKAMQPAMDAGMLSAGTLEVSAHGQVFMNSDGLAVYYPYTLAQFDVRVRDPQGTGSGWAGVSWNDWGRIDSAKLSQIALEKCLSSRNPVAVEPGRYVTILEPQAVADFVGPLCDGRALDRAGTEQKRPIEYPFSLPKRGETKLGQQVIDARLTITADPMDPDCGFLPFAGPRTVFHPTTWIERGVLQELGYDREYAIKVLLQNTGRPASDSFHMRGEGTATTIPEMIETTKRGVLVTRFSDMDVLDWPSLLVSGTTRDGYWFIEDGKITKPIKNMHFSESILAALNNLLQFGEPQRVFRPGAPAVVPALKIQDFNFTRLVDAV